MYTVSCDYFGTGEGSTVMVLITKGYGPKTPKENAMDEFSRIFGAYYAMGAEIHEGIKTDFLGSKLVIPEKTIEILQKNDAGNMNYFASMHVNYS